MLSIFAEEINLRGPSFSLVVALTLIAYRIYRFKWPASPNYHNRFIIAALISGLIVTSIWDHYLYHGDKFFNVAIPSWIFWSACFLSSYKLLSFLPVRSHRWLGSGAAVLLMAYSSFAAYGVYKFYYLPISQCKMKFQPHVPLELMFKVSNQSPDCAS